MRAYLSPARLAGTVKAPPSKSDAHRALIAAALSDRETRVSLPGSSQDIEATIRCLKGLGARFLPGDGMVTVRPIADGPKQGETFPLLDCGESGSTLRFLLPVAAAVCGGTRFAARGGLLTRPIGALRDCMTEHGVSFLGKKLPLSLTGKLTGGVYVLPGDVSSQYISGLLFALPILEGDSEIRLTTPLQSEGYVEMTLDTLKRFSVEIKKTAFGYQIRGGQRYRSPGVAQVEGDWSNAAFFLAAGALGGPVTVTGLSNESFQRDRRAVEILRRFGAKVEARGGAVTAAGAPLHGIRIDVRDIPDLVPALAVVASAAEGETVFENAARLRIKESDRLKSVSALLKGVGVKAREGPDSLIVTGTPNPSGGTVSSFGDHRIAMAAAIAASRCAGKTVIEEPLAVEKSYPSFYEDYRSVGGAADVL